MRTSLRQRLGALRNRFTRAKTPRHTKSLEDDPASGDALDAPSLDHSITQQKKLAALAAILGSSEESVRKLVYERALAGLPSRPHTFYMLPDLKIETCERVGEELMRIAIAGGRTFLGARSEQKEYLLHNFFRHHLPEIVTGDAYKLAMDIQRRYFSTRVLPKYFGEGGTYIEGGCFTGMKAIRWADLLTKPKRILAVEIGQRNFEILQANIKANDLQDSVIPVHAGLWHESGEGTQKHAFSTRRFLETTDRWENHMRYEEKVALLTLDDLLDKYEVEVADYVNIQVNGAEVHVLDGLKRNVDRVKVLDVAAYYSQDGKKNADVVEERLRSMGCEVLQRTPNGRITAVTPRHRNEVLGRARRHKRAAAVPDPE